MLLNLRLCSENCMVSHRVHLHRLRCPDITRPQSSEALLQSVIYIGRCAIHGCMEV